MILRSVETKDLNKVTLIGQKVDVTQVNDRYYLFFPDKELSLEIDNPFDKNGMLVNEYKFDKNSMLANEYEYEYKGDTAWFKVKSYDAVYTIEVEIKW